MKWVQLRSFHLRVSISNFPSCDRPGALCTFVQPIFPFLPCVFIQSGAVCHAVWGSLMKHVCLGSFRLREVISNLLSCDHIGTLCTLFWPIFHFLACAFIRWGASCHTMWCHPKKRVQVGSFCLREAFSNLLIFDCSGAFCTLVQPIWCLFPCAFIWLGALCHALFGHPMKRVHIKSFCLRVLDEMCSSRVISFEGGHIKFSKLWPLGYLVHVHEARLSFSPLFLHSFGWAMLCRTRVLDGMCSGRVVSFEGGHIKFSKLWPLRCLVHVRASCFPFSPLWLFSVGHAVSRYVRAPDEMHSDQIISFDGDCIKFDMLWLPRCLAHVRATRYPFSPLGLHLFRHVVSCRVMVPDETRSGRVVLFEGALSNLISFDH